MTKQIFEPWRTDAVNLHDVTESTLATIRRTVRFEIAKRPDGTFEMVPKVLVDRFTSAERRLTAINQYHQAFSGPRAFADSPDLSGDVTVEHGAAEYWYPLRSRSRARAKSGRRHPRPPRCRRRSGTGPISRVFR